MMTFILVIHSITCVLLVLTILMQSGRGGGLTEQFASAESVFGAQTSSFMVRTTSIAATVFFITSLTLALMSAGQERSLMANNSVAAAKVKKLSDVQIPAEPVKEAVDAAASMNATLPSEVSAVTQPEAVPALSVPDAQVPVATNTQQ